MGWSCGLDLRERVVDAIEAGLSHRQSAERSCVAVSTAGNGHRRRRATGSPRAGKQGQPRRCKLDVHEAEILAMVEQTRDIALHEIGDRLKADHGVDAVPSTVWHFLAKRNITLKKRRRLRRNNSART